MKAEWQHNDPAVRKAAHSVTIAQLAPLAGQDVATSDWLQVTQAMIDGFAEVTNDHQWIHVDVDRARTSLAHGRTIAHGFLVVSLLAPLFEETLQIGGTSSSINYGFNRLRFTSPVVSDSRIRARFHLKEYEELAGGAQLTWSVTIDVDGQEKPALIAEWLMRRYR